MLLHPARRGVIKWCFLYTALSILPIASPCCQPKCAAVVGRANQGSPGAPCCPHLPCRAAPSVHPRQKPNAEVTEEAGLSQDFSIEEVCSDAILAQKLVSASACQVPCPLPLTAPPGWGWLSEPRWERWSWKAPCFQAAYSIALTQPPVPLAWCICCIFVEGLR